MEYLQRLKALEAMVETLESRVEKLEGDSAGYEVDVDEDLDIHPIEPLKRKRGRPRKSEVQTPQA